MNSMQNSLADNRAIAAPALDRAAKNPVCRALAGYCVFETVYYFAFRYGMSFAQTCASPFWFPDSVLLCALLLSPRRHWWIFILGTLPIRLGIAVSAGIPWWFLLTTFAIDSVKGIAIAMALRHYLVNPLRLGSARDFAVYCLFAVVLIPAVAALGGAAARQHLGGYDFWNSWEQWLMGNVLAHLIVTPMILYWVVGFPLKRRVPTRTQWIEAALLAGGLTLTGYLAFRTQPMQSGMAENQFYLPVPFLFWAAIRFGMPGATGAIAFVAVLAVSAALSGRGAFAGQSPAGTALALQHFLLLRAAPLFLVAILIEQQKSDAADAQQQRVALAHAARVSTMGQFASALAHEINQPLAAILRNSEAGELLLGQETPDLEEIRAILEDIRKDDQRAGAVIDRMRSLLRRRVMEFEALPIRQLLEYTTDIASAELRGRRVALVTDIPANLPRVRGDRVHLQQVLLNLLVNGADAMSGTPADQRRLEVRATEIDAGTVEISVRDLGPGLPATMLSAVFDPFFTTKASGMGMGLAISKTIVEAHGGQIHAENHPEGGAVFRFTLKADEREEAAG